MWNVLEAADRIDSRTLCEAAGIDLAALDDDAIVPLARLVRLYELAARATGDGGFGLHVGERVDLRGFDVLGYVARHSATVGEALAHIARYFPLWTASAELTWNSDRSSACLAWAYVDGAITTARQDTEMTLLTVSRIASLTRERASARPREVRFRHRRPRDGSEHGRLFGAAAQFGMPANELIYERQALATPLTTSDPQLCRLLADYAEQLLAQTQHTGTAVDRAREILEHSIVDLATLARAMGTSTRSLQRILLAHGTSYRDLVDGVRRRLATRYLREGDHTVAEIADQLGYGRATELHRAFRAWTGTTPRRYRATARARR